MVAADSPLARSGMAALLSAVPGLEIVAERESLDSATMAAAGPVDLVLWELPVVDASVLERVREVCLDADCVVLVSSELRLAALAEAGARGILWREVDPERLRLAVQTVMAGASVFDEGMTKALLERRAVDPAGIDLTPREHEVLGLMAEGLSNKLIAARLGISEHTAKFHVNAVFDKLGAETRTEAVVRAARRGLLML